MDMRLGSERSEAKRVAGPRPASGDRWSRRRDERDPGQASYSAGTHSGQRRAAAS